MSITPQMIDAMMAAGVTREQMAAIIKADLMAAAAAAEEKRAHTAELAKIRKRRQRSGYVTDVTRDASDERDPLKVPPHPPITTPTDLTPSDPNGSSVPKGTRSGRKVRNRALPADWQPGAKSEASRVELGRPVAWMHRTATDMRTWAESKGEVRADWDATHVGWMRREALRESERPGVRAGPSREKATAVTAFADRMEARHERHQHQDQRSFRTDPAPVIDHEADGRFDREVHEPVGGPAGRFSSEAPIRLVGSRWR